MVLRIGILGAAKVATYAMIAPANLNANVMVQSVAARDKARAADYAIKHDIPEFFDSYDALIASPNIDAVYVALPPNVHAQWSVAAMEAGKHVLCEKPFTLDSNQVRAMNATAERTGKIMMEAQHTHYHPMLSRMRDLVREGVFGTIQRAECHFNIELKDVPGELRFLPDVGGGALWDLGVYCAFWLRSIFAAEPKIISARQRFAPSGADIETSAELKISDSFPATLSCSMDKPLSFYLDIIGSKGRLHSRWREKTLSITLNGITTDETFGDRTSYDYQLDAFVDAVKTGIPAPTSGEDSLKTILLLEAIVAAARK